MKKSEGDHLKYAVYESTLSPAARSPFPNGEGYDTRAPLSSSLTSTFKTSSGMKKAKGAYFLERKCSNFLGSPKFFGGG